MLKNLKIFLLLALIHTISCQDKVINPPTTKTNPLDTVTAFNGILLTANGSLTINVNHEFNGEVLVFDTKNYVAPNNDTINIEKLKYYISNIILVEPNGNEYNLNNYHLINAKDGRNKTFTLNNVKAGIYNKINFYIGIDSFTNTTGVGTGEIDPALGMFWDWNTGYIFYQCEGRTKDSRAYSIHIGGNQNLIKVSLNLNSYKIKSTNPTINLVLNFAEMFKNPVLYDFKTYPMQIHMPTSNGANIIRDNLSDVLSVKSVMP